MLITLILGALAAVVAASAEPHVKRALENTMMAEQALSPVDLKIFAFAVTLFVAAILSNIIGNGGAVSLTLGAVAGLIFTRLVVSPKE
ncbi:hypothetical protein P1J78_18400 [Psychromarinibacter sp. C21-152]|uniref:Uncharacterized protein n=1 Tax=Psychromarinibacter sediminicola TaxID=3033385 RepID=A0AAE3NXF0_9RHOB|nr:hypothetical protein [Psychromarinibacter sediminicola]MDF0602715.1 hypothetical protein [Psychromarinibacter sediminicola]